MNRNISRIFCLLVSALISGACGLVFVPYYQARVQRALLLPRAQIAVFAERNANYDVVREKLDNIDGVSSVEYVPADKAWEKALKEEPSLKDVLVTSENPFPAYFILHPRPATAETAAAIRESATAIEGISDVRYDAGLLDIAERLSTVAASYRYLLYIILAAAGLIIIAKITVRLVREDFKFLRALENAAIGAAGGIAGAGMYYSIARSAATDAFLMLPERFVPYFIAAGIISALLTEN